MIEGENIFVPDAEGFEVVLPDRVATQARFFRDPAVPTGLRAEWRVANRSFPTPEAQSIKTCVPRVTAYFETPHTILPPTKEPSALHQSHQGAFSVKSQLAREQGEVHGGASLGAAPRQLGELASISCIFGFFRGRYDGTDAYRNKTIHVETEHVERAAHLLKVVHLLKDAAVNTVDEDDCDSLDTPSAEEARRQEMMKFLGTFTDPFEG